MWLLPRILFVFSTLTWGHDLSIYFNYSDHIVKGHIPYSEFTVEYPPGALYCFLLPRLLTEWQDTYLTIFSLEILLADFLCFYVIKLYVDNSNYSIAQKNKVYYMYIILPVLLGLLSYRRFDFIPALFTMSALLFWIHKKYNGTWITLGVAVSIKLYPIILFPLFALAFIKQRASFKKLLTGFLIFLSTIALISLPNIITVGSKLLTFYTYHEKRGIQIESLYANMLMVAHVFGVPATFQANYGSWNIISPEISEFNTISLLITLSVQFIIIIYAWYSMEETNLHEALPRMILLSLLGFIITNKVLSPQYLIWILPFAVLVVPKMNVSKRIWPLLALTFILTTLIYPCMYAGILNFELTPWIILTTRNILLIVLFIAFSAQYNNYSCNYNKHENHNTGPVKLPKVLDT